MDGIEIVKRLEMDTKKSERIAMSEKIFTEYNNSQVIFSKNLEKLNSSPDLKVVFTHILVAIGYAKEIAILQKSGWNTSVESLTRNFLECFAIAKKLISLYGTPQYREFYKNLIVMDMIQDKRVLASIEADTTIDDAIKRSDIDTYIARFENLISEHFSERLGEIKQDDKLNSLKQIINKLKIEYDRKFPHNASKGDFIADALNNSFFKIDGVNVIYKQLSHSTHNTLSALEEKVLHNNIFFLNCNYHNLYPCVELVYHCLIDVNMVFSQILDNNE